jgi:hypothetical protein
LNLAKTEGGTAGTFLNQVKLALMKALAEQDGLTDIQLKSLEPLLKAAILDHASEESTALAALGFLRKYPLGSLQQTILEVTQGTPRVQLSAIITLKEYKNETAVERVAQFLESDLESLKGRALDTLTGLPGLRAKRILIDYLKNHLEDHEICDKVMRSLSHQRRVLSTLTKYWIRLSTKTRSTLFLKALLFSR